VEIPPPDATDLEKGLSGREQVVLSVSGMTCSGCETKLHRSIANLPSVSGIKTSLVLSRVEFEVDLSSSSADAVMRHIHRTTEFKCSRIANLGSTLDLLVPGDPSEFVDQEWPVGVSSITPVDKRTVRVAYDPETVGARDLARKGWNMALDLAPPQNDPSLQAGNKHVRHIGYMTLLSSILTIPVLVMAWAPLPERKIAYSSASMALATLVQVVIAGPFYPIALKSLIFTRLVEMDLLIVLSTSAAYIFSVVSFGFLVAGRPLATGEFFETSTLLVTLIMVGRYVSALARQKAVESISIRSLQTPTAILVDGGTETEIDCRLLQYGDVFKVVPESRIPTDGTVISGSSEVDESMLTGESMPVEKHVKSTVIAGSINTSGCLQVQLTRLPGDNTINTIAGMVDQAKLSRPRIQDITDRVASYFVPVIVVLALGTFIVWMAVCISVRKQTASDAATEAITYAITVLIVSCPCAIGLAVPMVIVIASGIAAERGIIFKSADSIELAHKTAHVVFDKTGTLTQGKLAVTAEEYLQHTDDSDTDVTKARLLGLIGSIKHPVSAAVSSHLRGSLECEPEVVTGIKTLAGKGVEGKVSGLVLRAGNSRWLGLSTSEHIRPILDRGHTAFCFTVNGSLAAVFGLTDSLRPDSLESVQGLIKAGIDVHIVSGDDDGAVATVASQLGIPAARVRSRATPADKQSYVQSLLDTPAQPRSACRIFRKWRKPARPVVMFCGDGTNDAPALAQATIGVHINEGTDVARSAADVVLMRPSLAGVLGIVAVSRMSVRRIVFNFAWSFVYNVFAVLLAAGAIVGARIPPEFAGLGELVSVLPVIAAAVLMRWARF
jgi:heavy metal translocating P-type ATPase